MVSPEDKSLEKAYSEVPIQWYEKLLTHQDSLRDNLLIKGIIFGPSAFAYEYFINQHTFETITVGISLYLLATAADRISTIKCLNIINKAENNGLPVVFEETHPMLRSIKTPNDLMTSKAGYFSDAVGVLASGMTLGFAIPMFAMKLLATANNLRVAKRHDRASEILTGY